MIYDMTEILVVAEAVIIGLIIVAAILNRQVLKDAVALGKSVKAGTGMAVDKAVNFFDGDGDGDVDLDDLKFIAANLNVSELRKAVVAALKQKEYQMDGIPFTPPVTPEQIFKNSVGKKSKGE